MSQDTHQSQKTEGRRSIVSLRLILLLLLLAALATMAAVSWKPLYTQVLERDAPVIKIVEYPRGVGIAPVEVLVELSDELSGLDEVVVRVRQRNRVTEILRRDLEGSKFEQIEIEFPGSESELLEGLAQFEVRVFDRSFWSNPAEQIIPLHVDYKRPELEVVTQQHNARRGGSQLVFYRASDDDLVLSGVRVGRLRFPGFPARGIDPTLEDPTLYLALYALPSSEELSARDVRLFAEDRVGNTATSDFYNRVGDRSFRPVTEVLDENYLRNRTAPLAEQASKKTLENDPLVKFAFVNEVLRYANEQSLNSLLRDGPRYEKLWDAKFAKQTGTAIGVFGDQVSFKYQNQEIGQWQRTGYEFSFPGNSGEVLAAADGVVVFAGNLGVYGFTVAIDHGLGLASVYSQLDSARVQKGDRVERGEMIGSPGRSGIARQRSLLFEVRVNGIPVDAREWWDASWIHSHIDLKIEEAKKALGIAVYRPLN